MDWTSSSTWTSSVQLHRRHVHCRPCVRPPAAAAACDPRLIRAAAAATRTQSHAVSLQSSTSGGAAEDTTWNDPLDTTAADDQQRCQVLRGTQCSYVAVGWALGRVGEVERPGREFHALSSSHLVFFKNSCQTQLCTKFIHMHVDTIKCYGDKLEMTVTIRQL